MRHNACKDVYLRRWNSFIRFVRKSLMSSLESNRKSFRSTRVKPQGDTYM